MKAIFIVPSYLAPKPFENWLETPPIPTRTIDTLTQKYSIVEPEEPKLESLDDSISY